MRAWRRMCAICSGAGVWIGRGGCSSKRAIASALSSSSVRYRSSPAGTCSGRISDLCLRAGREERPAANFEAVVYARGTLARRLFAEAFPTDAVGQLRAAAAADVDLGLVPAALVLKAAAPGAAPDQRTAGRIGRRPARAAQGVERAHGV